MIHNGIKIFLAKRPYPKKDRVSYMKKLTMQNPSKYKQLIIDEYNDECHVYTSWQHILLWFCGLFIILSLVSKFWYLFIILSIISIVMSKICKNNVERLLLGYDFLMLTTDMFIESVKEEQHD